MGIRQDTRDRIQAQIIDLGRRQLSTEGAAGLSLRAIARDLGMVSSAVYRYVASRDELLTLLLVDAYTDLADAVDAAAEQTPDTNWRSMIRAMAGAAREWAVTAPASWALLYGSPVPGYAAPAEATVGPGTRVVAALFRIIAHAAAAGDITIGAADIPEALSRDFDRLRAEFDIDCADAVLARCFTFWAGLIGAISLEVFGQYGADTLSNPAAVFELQITALTDLLSSN